MEISAMSDRQVAEESLSLLRAFAEVLTAMGNNPMAKAMMPGVASFSTRAAVVDQLTVERYGA